MDAVLAVMPALFGLLIGAGLQYLLGRAAESRQQLTLHRTQSYIDYFRALASTGHTGRTKETLGAATDAKVRICIYGSGAVVKRLHRFETIGATVNSPQAKIAVTELIQEMRRDAGTNLSKIDNSDFLPILFGPEKL